MFELGFGITLALSIILTILYAKLRQQRDELYNANQHLAGELKASKDYLPQVVKDVASKTIKEQSGEFSASAIEPMGKMVDELKKEISGLSNQNIENSTTFKHKMEDMTEAAKALRYETGNLSDLLKSSQKRGRHAEINIERVFEMAGLTKGIHYNTQQLKNDKKPDFV